MAFAEVVYVGVGGTQTYGITFPFLEQAHVFATVDGVAKVLTTDFTINVAGTQLTFIGATVIAGGERIVLYRVTPKLLGERLVDFADGSTLTADNLDTAVIQLLYIAQEAFDSAEACLPLADDGSDVWDALSKRLTELAAPSLANDAVRLTDLQSAQMVAGNLPAVTGADNDSMVAVVAGAWALRTAAQIRASLGLGTAALEDVGTAAGELVQLDGSAKLPAVDGSQLTNLAAAADILTIIADLHKTPTLIVNFADTTLANDTSATWRTDASGANNRMNISSGDEKFDTANKMSVDVAGNTFTLEPGVYVVEVDALFSNTDTAAASANVDIALTNDIGTALYTVPSAVLGQCAAATTHGPSVSVHKSLSFTVATTTIFALKARHDAAAGSVVCFGDATRIKVTRLGA